MKKSWPYIWCFWWLLILSRLTQTKLAFLCLKPVFFQSCFQISFIYTVHATLPEHGLYYHQSYFSQKRACPQNLPLSSAFIYPCLLCMVQANFSILAWDMECIALNSGVERFKGGLHSKFFYRLLKRAVFADLRINNWRSIGFMYFWGGPFWVWWWTLLGRKGSFLSRRSKGPYWRWYWKNFVSRFAVAKMW